MKLQGCNKGDGTEVRGKIPGGSLNTEEIR